MEFIANADHLEPIDDRVVVRADNEGVSAGGLHVPTTAQATAHAAAGTVVACGPGRLLECGMREPMGISVGDRIAFMISGSLPIRLGNEKLHVMKRGVVLGVLHGARVSDSPVLVS